MVKHVERLPWYCLASFFLFHLIAAAVLIVGPFIQSFWR